MKILQIAPYVTNNNYTLLSQCKSGFGYMVYDIAKSLACTDRVDMLLTNYRYNGFDSDLIHFVAATPWLFLKNMGSCISILRLLKLRRKYRMQFRTFIRLIYVWLISGYYYRVIKTGRYDIVHIHGCGFNEDFIIDICKKTNVPFLITLHGLNSFSDSVKLESAGKRYERDFLKRVVKGEFPITVISTGIKKIILKEYGVYECNNINVVCNSFTFPKLENYDYSINIRQQYNLNEKSTIILYVGNLCHRKNQKQIVKSFELLPQELANETFILFLGKELDSDYNFANYINESKCSEHFILCGNINKENIPYYYDQCNGVALLSISEGFGLSLIEGMHFGKPCMTFTDLDAFDDIYNSNCVVGVEDRNDASVAEGLRRLLSETWDETEIKKHSEKFVAARMAENYINQYKTIIE